MSVDIFLGTYYKKNMLTVEMKYNKSKDCYMSPFFRTGAWVCGGEYSTGNTTQNYDAPNIKNILETYYS